MQNSDLILKQAAATILQIQIQPEDQSSPIVRSIHFVSQCLIELSLHHAELDSYSSTDFQGLSQCKNRFIAAATSILQEAKRILEMARPWVEKLGNAILRKELLSTLTSMETISHQLKIIVAVKASSPGDKDKAFQVVQCCQNLVSVLHVCLYYLSPEGDNYSKVADLFSPNFNI
jgi:hypothetical protein